MLERDAPFGFQRAVHGIGIHRLHADDPDLGAQLFDVGRHAGDQPAAADGAEDGVDRPGVLAQDFHRDGALPGDYIWIVIGVHEGHAFLFFQFQRMLVGVGIRIAVQYHFRAAIFHRINLDLWRGDRHHDDCLATKFLRGQRHALRMVARRGGDDATL